MARLQVWNAFLGWLKPGIREDSAQPSRLTLAMAPGEHLDPRMCFDEAGQSSTDAELLEFLAADEDPIPADPEFRERLREELWGLVREGVTAHPKDH